MQTAGPFSADGNVVIAASVATGLENVAADEIQEKVMTEPEKGSIIPKQGRVYFRTNKRSLAMLHSLRSVDRLFLVVKTRENYVYKTKEASLSDLKELANELDWSEVVKFWFSNRKYDKGKLRQEDLSKKPPRPKRQKLDGNANTSAIHDESLRSVLPQSDELEHSNVNHDKMNLGDEQLCPQRSMESSNNSGITNSEVKPGQTEAPVSEAGAIPAVAPDGTLIKFRVSSNRVGKKQPITSPEASYKFGGEIQDLTKWKVDLSNYNLEIMLCLGESSLEVAVALTLQSLHRRNITHFGMTTLRATTAYSMLKLCDIQPGDIVIDPMCGSGAIPVEGSMEWPEGFHIGGDNAKAAVLRCDNNVKYLNENSSFGTKFSGRSTCRKTLPVECIRWDVTCLPLNTSSADVIVSDLPFGKRVGSKADNRKLYPALLKELARIASPGTGRACLLTQDKRTITRALGGLSELWKIKKTLFINIGGLTAGIFLLKRTKNIYHQISAAKPEAVS